MNNADNIIKAKATIIKTLVIVASFFVVVTIVSTQTEEKTQPTFIPFCKLNPQCCVKP